MEEALIKSWKVIRFAFNVKLILMLGRRHQDGGTRKDRLSRFWHRLGPLTNCPLYRSAVHGDWKPACQSRLHAKFRMRLSRRNTKARCCQQNCTRASLKRESRRYRGCREQIARIIFRLKFRTFFYYNEREDSTVLFSICARRNKSQPKDSLFYCIIDSIFYATFMLVC